MFMQQVWGANPRFQRKIVYFLDVLLLLLVLASFPARANSCAERLSELKITNLNAAVSAEDYSLTNYRSLNDYKTRMGAQFTYAVSKLHADDTFMDLGSGLGVAARGVEQIYGSHTIMINPQNYSDFFDIFYSLTAHNLRHELSADNFRFDRSFKHGTIEKLILPSGAKVDVYKIQVAMRIFGKDVGDEIFDMLDPAIIDSKQYYIRKRFSEMLTEIVTEFKKTPAKGEFKVGLAEDVLPLYPRKAKIITDMYGAFFYSPRRLEILEKTYAALADDGLAFIHMGDGNLDSRNPVQAEGSGDAYQGDSVGRILGASLTLGEWLIQKYPKIFSYEYEPRVPNRRTLIMKRVSGVEALDLEKHLKLVNASYYARRNKGFAVPSLYFVERN